MYIMCLPNTGRKEFIFDKTLDRLERMEILRWENDVKYIIMSPLGNVGNLQMKVSIKDSTTRIFSQIFSSLISWIWHSIFLLVHTKQYLPTGNLCIYHNTSKKCFSDWGERTNFFIRMQAIVLVLLLPSLKKKNVGSLGKNSVKWPSSSLDRLLFF